MFTRKRQDPDLTDVLRRRVKRGGKVTGSLIAVLEDAVFRQEMRWLQDQLLGRPSVV